MGINMGIGQLALPGSILFRKFRWNLTINGVAGLPSGATASILPPSKAARPSLSFKEIECQHLNETIYFPGKPEWKPLNVTLYGLACVGNPVFTWIKSIYSPQLGRYSYPIDNKFIIDNITLEMLDAAGETLEEWTYKDCWIKDADWGDLDMSDSALANVDLSIRYARAYAAPTAVNYIAAFNSIGQA